jgi:hypothetical protein
MSISKGDENAMTEIGWKMLGWLLSDRAAMVIASLIVLGMYVIVVGGAAAAFVRLARALRAVTGRSTPAPHISVSAPPTAMQLVSDECTTGIHGDCTKGSSWCICKCH